MRRERLERAKTELLSPEERDALEAQLGAIVGPIIDAKLEAKAVELVERYRLAWLSVSKSLFGETTDRDRFLVSRDEAAELLGVSLSTVKRMEDSGELPEPIKFGERIVRHRLIDIEAIAKVKRRT
jgi:excisionase family DNA binding protein